MCRGCGSWSGTRLNTHMHTHTHTHTCTCTNSTCMPIPQGQRIFLLLVHLSPLTFQTPPSGGRGGQLSTTHGRQVGAGPHALADRLAQALHRGWYRRVPVPVPVCLSFFTCLSISSFWLLLFLWGEGAHVPLFLSLLLRACAFSQPLPALLCFAHLTATMRVARSRCTTTTS